MYQIGFIIEQALGHKTHGQNLQQTVPDDPEIIARWALPSWQTDGLKAKLPIYKSNWTVQAGLQARQAIANWQQKAPLDGLFFHTQVPAMLSQNWIKKVPSVVSLDATPLQYDRLGDFYEHETGPSWLEKKKYDLNVSCYQAATHLVTWSQWAKDGLVDEYNVPSDKITVIPPGVPVAEWTPSTQEPAKSAIVKILFVGANFERKGGSVLLEAFRRVRASIPLTIPASTHVSAVELHLVTRDPVQPEPGVFVYNDMKPNSPDLKRLFHQSDIFCLPTFGDCLPMVLSEAGAAGLPLVSTNVAAIPEIVRHEETGLLVEPHEVPALAVALRHLVFNRHLRLAYGKHAQRLVAHAHDAQKNSRRLLALLKQKIHEGRLIYG